MNDKLIAFVKRRRKQLGLTQVDQVLALFGHCLEPVSEDQ